MTVYDIAIIGAGPGGLACALKAVELGLSHILLEKGHNIFQGIIDSYPRGKKVYPTIPKGESGPFPVEELMPDEANRPVEEYLEKIGACIQKHKINIRPGCRGVRGTRCRRPRTFIQSNSIRCPAVITLSTGGSFEMRSEFDIVMKGSKAKWQSEYSSKGMSRKVWLRKPSKCLTISVSRQWISRDTYRVKLLQTTTTPRVSP